jgi:CBS domain containing-hemolysin-like protein
MLILIGSTLAAILISGVCSVAEATLLSLSPIRLETLKQQGLRYAATLLNLRDNVDRPIAAILILNTIANTGGAVVAGSAFAAVFGETWLWLFTLLLALAILYLSEIIPKIAGVVYNDVAARPVAYFLRGAIIALYPLILLTEVLSKSIRGKASDEAKVSATDVVTMAHMARSSNIIGSEQETIITNALQLRETTVQRVMIPREQVTFFNLELTTQDNLRAARQSMHTRYPVSATNEVDKLIGYVHIKELALAPEQLSNTLEPFVRPLLVVTPTTKLSLLLKRMIAGRQHMVIVKDPRAGGQVLGLVTLEDVIEEIIGEIEDEFDNSPLAIIPVTTNTWNVGGGATMGALAEHVALELGEEEGRLKVAEWLEGHLGHTVRAGQSFCLEQMRFTVLQARRGRVQYALVERLASEETPDATAHNGRT